MASLCCSKVNYRLQERRICVELRGEMRRAVTELEEMVTARLVWQEVEERLAKDFKTRWHRTGRG